MSIEPIDSVSLLSGNAVLFHWFIIVESTLQCRCHVESMQSMSWTSFCVSICTNYLRTVQSVCCYWLDDISTALLESQEVTEHVLTKIWWDTRQETPSTRSCILSWKDLAVPHWEWLDLSWCVVAWGNAFNLQFSTSMLKSFIYSKFRKEAYLWFNKIHPCTLASQVKQILSGTVQVWMPEWMGDFMRIPITRP